MARLTRMNDAELRRIVADHVRQLTADVLAEAERTTPGSGRGELQRSHHMDVDDSGPVIVGRVWNSAPYAIYVHEGRGPIRAKPGKALGPLPPPYPRFVRRVRGAAGQPWLVEALERAQPYPVRRRSS
nr:HK97 gp10 family phage protein [Streptomyces sp. NBRC 109706]